MKTVKNQNGDLREKPIAHYLILAVLLVIPTLVVAETSPTPLSAAEATALLHELPGVKGLASRGMGLSCYDEMMGANGLNRDAYYFRTCRMTNEPKESASSLFGHFAVNKWTADVWDFVLRSRVEDAHLSKKIATLRVRHRLDAATIARYEGVPLVK